MQRGEGIINIKILSQGERKEKIINSNHYNKLEDGVSRSLVREDKDDEILKITFLQT